MAEYPAKLSYEEGTSIWMQYVTAWGALIHHAHIAKGDFVIITAASSSVGLAAIEMVKAEGGISIAATRTADKKAELLAFGADHVIVTDEEDLVARVNEITGGKGARIVFDPIGGKGLATLAEATAREGIIIEYGALATDPAPYPLFTALSKSLTIRAYTLFEFMAGRMSMTPPRSTSSSISRRATSSRVSPRPSRSPRSSRRTATWSPTRRSARSSSPSNASPV